MSTTTDPFGARDRLEVAGRSHVVHRLDALGVDVSRMPYTVRVLLEGVLRNAGSEFVTEDDVRALAGWRPGSGATAEVPYLPARVVLQDFTGVPCVADLAALRSAMRPSGRSRKDRAADSRRPRDRPFRPVGRGGTPNAFWANLKKEFERNRERYTFLRWGQEAFKDFRIVPPGLGICHQINLEYLARCDERGRTPADVRVSGYARRHGLPHDDDQRARRPRLGASAVSRPRRRCSASPSRS